LGGIAFVFTKSLIKKHKKNEYFRFFMVWPYYFNKVLYDAVKLNSDRFVFSMSACLLVIAAGAYLLYYVANEITPVIYYYRFISICKNEDYKNLYNISFKIENNGGFLKKEIFGQLIEDSRFGKYHYSLAFCESKLLLNPGFAQQLKTENKEFLKKRIVAHYEYAKKYYNDESQMNVMEEYYNKIVGVEDKSSLEAKAKVRLMDSDLYLNVWGQFVNLSNALILAKHDPQEVNKEYKMIKNFKDFMKNGKGTNCYNRFDITYFDCLLKLSKGLINEKTPTNYGLFGVSTVGLEIIYEEYNKNKSLLRAEEVGEERFNKTLDFLEWFIFISENIYFKKTTSGLDIDGARQYTDSFYNLIKDILLEIGVAPEMIASEFYLQKSRFRTLEQRYWKLERRME